MAKNDEKIRELMDLVSKKKKALGDKPKATWVTNGIFKYDDSKFFNLNTVKDFNILVDALAFLLQRNYAITEAAQALEVPAPIPSWGGYKVYEWRDDFKTRIAIINWEAKKVELEATEAKLSTLVSEEARTEMALDDIAKSLG